MILAGLTHVYGVRLLAGFLWVSWEPDFVPGVFYSQQGGLDVFSWLQQRCTRKQAPRDKPLSSLGFSHGFCMMTAEASPVTEPRIGGQDKSFYS